MGGEIERPAWAWERRGWATAHAYPVRISPNSQFYASSAFIFTIIAVLLIRCSRYSTPPCPSSYQQSSSKHASSSYKTNHHATYANGSLNYIDSLARSKFTRFWFTLHRLRLPLRPWSCSRTARTSTFQPPQNSNQPRPWRFRSRSLVLTFLRCPWTVLTGTQLPRLPSFSKITGVTERTTWPKSGTLVSRVSSWLWIVNLSTSSTKRQRIRGTMSRLQEPMRWEDESCPDSKLLQHLQGKREIVLWE